MLNKMNVYKLLPEHETSRLKKKEVNTQRRDIDLLNRKKIKFLPEDET